MLCAPCPRCSVQCLRGHGQKLRELRQSISLRFRREQSSSATVAPTCDRCRSRRLFAGSLQTFLSRLKRQNGKKCARTSHPALKAQSLLPRHRHDGFQQAKPKSIPSSHEQAPLTAEASLSCHSASLGSMTLQALSRFSSLHSLSQFLMRKLVTPFIFPVFFPSGKGTQLIRN